jgi:hypothetical protein
MRFTKLGHSCVRLEKDGAAVVIDPGGWSDPAAALAGAAAVMVTHEHPDHLDSDAVRTALRASPELTFWANPSITAQFAEFGGRVHETRHGDVLSVAGFDVHVYGRDHALIHPDIPLVANTGFLVDRELLVPISAPWMKAAEMIGYFREVAPARGYAIHDAILNANGVGLMTRMMSVAAAPAGAEVGWLEPGTSVEL